MNETTERRDGEPLVRLRDNPILIAQARRRMRRSAVIPSLAIAFLTGLCACTFTALISQAAAEAWTILSWSILSVVAIVLYFRGALMVAQTVQAEQESGLLDFHRATPTTPWSDVLGYLLGVPAREYALCAVALPFFLMSLYLSTLSVVDGLVAVAAVVVSGWLYHAWGTVVGLQATGKRGVRVSFVIAIVLLSIAARPLEKAGILTLSYLTPVPLVTRALASSPSGMVRFFGIAVPPIAYFLLVQGTMLSFLLWAAARKMRAIEMPLFSRLGSLGFFTVVSLLLLGGSWELIAQADGIVLGVVIGTDLVAAGVLGSLLLIAISPSHLGHFKALSRALRAGQDAPPWTDDGAAPWATTAAMGALSVGTTAAILVAGGHTSLPILTSVVGVSAIAAIPILFLYVTAVTHYVSLTYRGTARSWALLVGFLTLALPWMLAAMLGSGASPWLQGGVAALSPLFGLGAAISQLGRALGGQELDEVVTRLTVLSLGVTVAISAALAVAATMKSGELRRRAEGVRP